MESYWLEANGNPDPPVWGDYGVADPEEWHRDTDTFSEFVDMELFADSYLRSHLPRSRNSLEARSRGLPPFEKHYANGLWLRTPAEPFVPAVIDYLTEQIDEPERTPRPGNVTTYTWRPAGGTIRVTADAPGLGGGLSAWWMHAESPERLAELVRLVLPFGTLRKTLRADIDPAREVLRAIV